MATGRELLASGSPIIIGFLADSCYVPRYFRGLPDRRYTSHLSIVVMGEFAGWLDFDDPALPQVASDKRFYPTPQRWRQPEP